MRFQVGRSAWEQADHFKTQPRGSTAGGCFAMPSFRQRSSARFRYGSGRSTDIQGDLFPSNFVATQSARMPLTANISITRSRIRDSQLHGELKSQDATICRLPEGDRVPIESNRSFWRITVDQGGGPALMDIEHAVVPPRPTSEGSSVSLLHLVLPRLLAAVRKKGFCLDLRSYVLK